MVQTFIVLYNIPWYKPLMFCTIYHGTNLLCSVQYSMVQTFYVLYNIPWYKPLMFCTIFHGTNLLCSVQYSMVQTFNVLYNIPWYKPLMFCIPVSSIAAMTVKAATDLLLTHKLLIRYSASSRIFWKLALRSL
jgi:hypothetical protein